MPPAPFSLLASLGTRLGSSLVQRRSLTTTTTTRSRGVPEDGRGKRLSAYNLYVQEAFQTGSIRELPASERLRAIAANWRKLSESEKDRLRVRAQQLESRQPQPELQGGGGGGVPPQPLVATQADS
eukprot:RCo047377